MWQIALSMTMSQPEPKSSWSMSPGRRLICAEGLDHKRCPVLGIVLHPSDEGSARHEAPDHLIQVLRQQARFLTGSCSGAEFLPLLDRHDLHRRGIVADETSDGFASEQMQNDDFRRVRWLHAPVPHPSG